MDALFSILPGAPSKKIRGIAHFLTALISLHAKFYLAILRLSKFFFYQG